MAQTTTIAMLWIGEDGTEDDPRTLMDRAEKTRGLPLWMAVVLAEAMSQASTEPVTMLHQWLERPLRMGPDVEQLVKAALVKVALVHRRRWCRRHWCRRRW